MRDGGRGGVEVFNDICGRDCFIVCDKVEEEEDGWEFWFFRLESGFYDLDL